ncbi:MAG: PAS domain-containing protein [Caulobacter sp.]|nr:PAS domain-containing protein [Caulobacter sp.]
MSVPIQESSPGEADAAGWFFENSRDLFVVAGPDGAIRRVNRAWTEVTGWTTDELIGRRPISLIHRDDRADYLAMARSLDLDGEGINVARVQTRDGGWLWFEARNRRTDRGDMVGILRDVTADRARDAELLAARRDQAMLSEAAGIGAWAFEPLTGKIAWSPDVLALLGWSKDEIDTPESFLERLEADQRETVGEAFTRGVETGEGATVEHRICTADGRWLTMRATFRTESRGSLFALKGISQDVTELAAARDAALRGEQRVTTLAEELTANSIRLKMALAAAEAGAFEIDHENQSFWASDKFYELVGRRLRYQEIIRPDDTLVHPDDAGSLADAIRRWTDDGPAQAADFRLLRPDGDDRWVRVFYTADPEARRGVGLIMDIDARKRQELALVAAEQTAMAATEAKARFLANMSHELRTPMNGVLGVLHLLQREPLTDEGRGLLEEALGCGQMLTTLLNDVVDFSRIEAGRMDLAVEPVQVGNLIQGVVRLLSPQARDKGVALRLEGADALGWALTDDVRLRQALFNLIGNAVKFTLKGHVAIRCARDCETLRFEIEDTGVGIPLAAQESLFQRFHQADGSTTRQFGGSGLGLAITGRLAELMGGGVDFVSSPGEGSTFTLTVRAPAPATAPLTEPAETGGEVLSGLRILVVEDNPTNRMIAVKLLESLGAEAATANDGEDGVAAAALDGPAAQVPIIALTANVMSHQRHAYLAAGMDGVVAKPMSPAALLTEIVRISGGDAAIPDSNAA